MGLDMYAVRAKPDMVVDPQAQVDLKPVEGANAEQLFYWRKHNALHGWMEKLYREKGGTDPNFNCNTVRLTKEDLDRLENAITGISGERLMPTEGFFFGGANASDGRTAEDFNFLTKARAALDEGDIVWYDSWW